RSSGDFPPQGGPRQRPDSPGGQRVHCGLRGGTGRVYLSGRGRLKKGEGKREKGETIKLRPLPSPFSLLISPFFPSPRTPAHPLPYRSASAGRSSVPCRRSFLPIAPASQAGGPGQRAP